MVAQAERQLRQGMETHAVETFAPEHAAMPESSSERAARSVCS